MQRESLGLVDIVSEAWVLDLRYATLCVNAYRAGNTDTGEENLAAPHRRE